ncbi:MAG: Sua5/YciO/YrdC/YwlC family protein [bacterium]|nr:Sua5/YciO/YrdC/YwlC family protein [bacterium]MCP5070808.1 Sua5/YciO/YrdC/YwlC family protein [bacterium]
MGEAVEVSATEAAKRLVCGELVAFPTETSWGLAADATSARGVAALFDWKRRVEGQPLSVLVEGPEALGALGVETGPDATRLAARFWPGPLTLVLPLIPRSNQRLAPGVADERGSLGVRCSPHPDANALAVRVAELGAGPITATSLNRSGEPPARSRSEARSLCGGAGDPTLLMGEECGGGLPSSVVDCSVHPPEILREAAISRSALESAFVPRSTAQAS